MKKKDKWEAYDVKKQTICIVPQSNESSARHSPEPTWGKPFIHFWITQQLITKNSGHLSYSNQLPYITAISLYYTVCIIMHPISLN